MINVFAFFALALLIGSIICFKLNFLLLLKNCFLKEDLVNMYLQIPFEKYESIQISISRF